MIASLSGTLTRKQPDWLIVDVNGVGYRVFTPLSTYYELPDQGEPISLIIRTNVTDDAILLYGFLTDRERELFDMLRSVSGIGPRLALAVLSGLPPEELIRALADGNAGRLTAVPGVGKKTAQRMVVDLKDKAAKTVWFDLAAQATDQTEDGLKGQLAEDALSALVNLGYNRNQALKAINKAGAELGDQAALEDVIRVALKGLVR